MGKILGAIVAAIVAFNIFITFVPAGRSMWNDNYTHELKKADERQYESRKKVEDTARAMIASYKSDIETYNQYKDSTSVEKQSWAEQAKMRANATANAYNEYLLKNSYVWNANIPQDIKGTLPIVK